MDSNRRARISPPLLLVIFAAAVAGIFAAKRIGGWCFARADSAKAPLDLAAQARQLEAQEESLNRTVWAPEILAERCGRAVDSLWDSLNASTDKLALAASFPVSEVVLGRWTHCQHLAHGIQRRLSSGAGPVEDQRQWQAQLAQFRNADWQLEQVEFRHTGFELAANGQPKRSRYYFSAHLNNPQQCERAQIEGDLWLDWAPPASPQALAAVKRVDASGLRILTRRGRPAFENTLTQTIVPPEKSFAIDPLIVRDLEGDGRPEIILAAKNLVFRLDPNGTWRSSPLCRFPLRWIFSGVIADFDGDGFPDFLCAKYEGLFLFKGSPRGTFDEPARLVWSPPESLPYPMVMTCGDVDGDGDLDVFLGQYRQPYENGNMPVPFYDANDGYPCYLLLNDGRGDFADATRASGLTQKRRRRIFSSCLVDLDGDGRLDLAVASDFAGLDVYRNTGGGHFTDMTAKWIPNPHAFGMSQTLADFNGDGRLDLLLVGMNSPTVDRLQALNLWRPGSGEDRSMRSSMTFGNRLLLAQPAGGFAQNSMSDSIARSGWSWGCAAFDFDNDGYPDVYIANGHESNRSVREYEPEYWLHDAFVGNAQEDPLAYAYFQRKFYRTRGRDQSYGGYEKNRLYLNQGGNSFLEAGYLMGVALENDSRNVVAADLDGDGRVDLVVTTYEIWPELKQTLRIYKNALPDAGHWIGFRFRPHRGEPPIGARLKIHWAGRQALQAIVTGDSYRSQNDPAAHFGLGVATAVDSVEIRWSSGRKLILQQPAIDRWHWVEAPAGP